MKFKSKGDESTPKMKKKTNTHMKYITKRKVYLVSIFPVTCRGFEGACYDFKCLEVKYHLFHLVSPSDIRQDKLEYLGSLT